MILQEEVLVTITGFNLNYYKNKNYIIPTYYNKNNYYFMVKRGTKISVKIIDLQENSHIKVLCKCDNPKCKSKPKMIVFQSLQKPSLEYFCYNCAITSKEHCENISKSTLGKKRKNPFTKEHKNKIAMSRIGEKNPMWNPNLTDEERMISRISSGYHKWKKLVKKRDDYTCQCCGSKKHLHIHHINSFKKFENKRENINNGITLCFECHSAKNGRSIHNIYGKHPTKENFDIFMKNYKII
jgi:hypothetical protein